MNLPIAPAQAIRTVLVDDDPIVRGELARLLAQQEGLVVLATFASAEEALFAIDRGLQADVALVDLGLPGMHGHALIRELRKRRSSLEVVVLTTFHDDEHLFGALRAGATGYLLKDATAHELCRAIGQVHEGGAPMSPCIARRVLMDFRAPAVDPTSALTRRELDVLGLLTKGASYPLIGEALAISTSTVQSHIRAIYRKLEVCTKAEATAEAYKRGWIR